MVPARTVATVNITVAGESDSMSKKTKILIEPPAFIHIIQTDKPIYKPGQTGTSPTSAPRPQRRVSCFSFPAPLTDSAALAGISITLSLARKL